MGGLFRDEMGEGLDANDVRWGNPGSGWEDFLDHLDRMEEDKGDGLIEVPK